jgi:hypothetical protein
MLEKTTFNRKYIVIVRKVGLLKKFETGGSFNSACNKLQFPA